VADPEAVNLIIPGSKPVLARAKPCVGSGIREKKIKEKTMLQPKPHVFKQAFAANWGTFLGQSRTFSFPNLNILGIFDV
jgi:hypothetical protein